MRQVGLQNGGGLGMGFSRHARLVIVCDGARAAARRAKAI
jgi:urocanate hydratase